MQIVKLFLLSVLILSAVVLGISFLLPSQVRISRATDIYAPAEQISDSIGNLETWKNWNALLQDSSLINAQFDSALISDKGLNISLEHKSGDSVSVSWLQNETQTRSGFNIIRSEGEVTIVQWYFDFELKWYPWQKFASIIFDKQLGPPMEKSLAALKESIEKIQQ